ncbi:histone-lysine N-methyltransferase SETMAR-like [Limulus polyphemus]|uniref:Histone-lysine N-methyltransferase SETMAR-like n=1 Tax=Limulus polyphemus TaxID=6850 RepID=A0ABM1B562_LIMPO|nr:histone-lysine N-methyltransferase SETMAR-like [Limulus polyphemus]
MFDPTKEHIRHVMLYEFHRGINASAAAIFIQNTYGVDGVSERTCRRWFSRVKNGDFGSKDEPREGRSSGLDSEALKAAVAANPAITVRDLSEQFNVSHMTVHRELKRLGKVLKVGKCFPHDLSVENRQQRVDYCEVLHSLQNQLPFLDRVATGYEKWILCHNVKRRRLWLSRGNRLAQQPRGILASKEDHVECMVGYARNCPL